MMILYSFGKIGVMALGGGNSMIKLIEYETVFAHQWLSQQEFAGLVGTSFLFPGLTAVKIAGLIGYKIAGFPGLVIAALSLNLPGLLFSIIGYRFLMLHHTPFTQKIQIIFQYGAISLLAAATWSIAYDIIRVNHIPVLILTTILFFLALAKYDISPFWGFIGFIGLNLLLI